ncbi:MAG: hypothetical protein R3F37_14930 [Candidatus Competibacteraceae bacterium]
MREEIVARQGCTVLLATHNAEEALELCDRVAVLHKGRVLAQGKVDELVSRVGDEYCRVSTKSQAYPVLRSLMHSGHIHKLNTTAENDDGWIQYELHVPGGSDQAAEIVASVVKAGVPVCQFERSKLTLAGLLDRILSEAGDV